MQKGAGKIYGLAFVASVASAVVLAKIISITSIHTIPYGLKIGVAVWLGFVTTVQLTGALFGKQPIKLYLNNTGYQLVCYLAMGALLAKWPHCRAGGTGVSPVELGVSAGSTFTLPP